MKKNLLKIFKSNNSNYLFFMIITGLMFYVSASWTGRYFFSDVRGIFTATIAISATIGIELFKIRAWVAYNTLNDKKIGKRTLIMTWTALTIASLMFSMSANINSINQNDNEIVTQSLEYKRQQELYNLSLDKYKNESSKIKEIGNIDKILNEDSQLKALNTQLKNMSTIESYIKSDSDYNSYINLAKKAESEYKFNNPTEGSKYFYNLAKTRKNKLTKEYNNNLNKLTNDKINRENYLINEFKNNKKTIESTINNEFQAINKIKNGFTEITGKVKDTKGVNGIIRLFSFGNETTYQILSFLFVLFVGLLIDFSACKSFQLAQAYKNESQFNFIKTTQETLRPMLEKQHKESPAHAKADTKLIIESKLDESKTFAMKVLKIMKEQQEITGKVPSINKIATIVDADINQVKSARDVLKEDGLIKIIPLGNSKNCKTIIL